ncbi:MAG: hypothetical protein GWP06_17290 [Actinobacteria bacterium]|nr:hypothetical protein [Actinomycetota bacterium]
MDRREGFSPPSRAAGLRRHALPDALRPVPVLDARRHSVKLFSKKEMISK